MAILTQKYQEHNEKSLGFQGIELKYPEINKRAYVVFKLVKYFKTYLLKSNTKVIVPYPAIRNVLVKNNLGEKIAHWISTL